MAPALPVPSKGALRTLRHIALGTSCTVAFSAGVVTEDRRRRIHSAREVRDNGKKLKSSRKYHNTGMVVGETFEEQVMHYGESQASTKASTKLCYRITVGSRLEPYDVPDLTKQKLRQISNGFGRGVSMVTNTRAKWRTITNCAGAGNTC